MVLDIVHRHAVLDAFFMHFCSLVAVFMFDIDFSFFFLYVLVAELSMSSNFSTVVSFEQLNWNYKIYGT